LDVALEEAQAKGGNHMFAAEFTWGYAGEKGGIKKDAFATKTGLKREALITFGKKRVIMILN
jgi:hypothetical protein